MDYYHSHSMQSPPIKKYPTTSSLTNQHSANETGKSNTSSPKSTNNIHMFFAEQEEKGNKMNRKLSNVPSMPELGEKQKYKNTNTNSNEDSPKKKSNRQKNKNKKNANNKEKNESQTIQKPQKPSKEIIVKRKMPENKKDDVKQDVKKENVSAEVKKDENDTNFFAGGGYSKTPNPKQFSKPNLISPPKKEKKSSQSKMDTQVKPQSLHDRFVSSHSVSAPQLMNVPQNPSFMLPYPPHPSMMMPNMQPFPTMFAPSYVASNFSFDPSLHNLPASYSSPSNSKDQIENQQQQQQQQSFMQMLN